MKRMAFSKDGSLISVDGSLDIWADEKESQLGSSGLLTSKDLDFLNEQFLPGNPDSPYWSLHESGKNLAPMVYSNGKTQADIVKEVVELIHSGKKVVFIHGVCGTGKSAIALNISRLLGKSSIVVPIKSLQKQYEEDYTRKKYVLKPAGKKMRIAIITGRDNHDSIIRPGVSCADPMLPDNILIAEKNRYKLVEYYNENPFIKNKIIPDIRRMRRISVGPANPYWSPIVSEDYDLSQLLDAKKKIYHGVDGKKYVFYHRKQGCSYYDQFQAYLDADVIIFNSAKYEIEMAIGRKPESDVDIIDEADAFLDSFSKEISVDLMHFQNSLQHLLPDNIKAEAAIKVINELLVNEIKQKGAIGIDESKIYPLKETFFGRIISILLENRELQAEILLDESNYANKALEAATMFEDMLPGTYVTYRRFENSLFASLVTINVSKKFQDLMAKTKALVLMSGTLHSPEVLENVFGITDYSVVEAETKTPGTISIFRSGKEFNCEHRNLSSGKEKRKQYLLALSECMKNAKKPVLVHVNAFDDLPSDFEVSEYGISNLVSRESLKSMQKEDRNGDMIASFKSKKSSILFTTKCSRGIDFPGDMCNSVIFTKYPNPNTRDIFWQVLRLTHSAYYWSFYADKAKREFLQRLYRALRSPQDKVLLLSPDTRVLDAARFL